MAFMQFEIEFTKDGYIHEEAKVSSMLDKAPSLTDLFVLSHGWNNNKQEAARLYEDLQQSIARLLDSDKVPPELKQRQFGVMRVYWPSKRFTEEDLIPGGGAASATRESEATLIRLLDALKRDSQLLPESQDGEEIDPVRSAAVESAKALIERLGRDQCARREFILHMRSLLDPRAVEPDDASDDFFINDPEKIFTELSGPVEHVPLPPARVGATSMTGIGQAAGLSDLLDGVKAAARRIANFTTYYEMKQRAGTVGSNGVAQVLRLLRERNGNLRLHLVGHSFGGRLVTAAAHALPDNTPAVTITLLQAAFSHNGLAEKFDRKRDGAFRELVTKQRASGPIIITYTKNDRAVGIAYPLASRISRDPAATLGTSQDPYGGMGRNGAQHTPEAKNLDGQLLDVNDQYSFKQGQIYNLNADAHIKDHGDVTGRQVAYAVLCAAKTI